MSGWISTAPMLPDHDLDPPDYGDYEKDEDYLDNVAAGYSNADAAMDEAIDEMDGQVLAHDDLEFGTPDDDIENPHTDKCGNQDRE